MNANQKELWQAIRDVKNGFIPNATVMLAGIEFKVTTVTVNRKCYDFNTTPTLMIKANGKRSSYDKAMDMLEA